MFGQEVQKNLNFLTGNRNQVDDGDEYAPRGEEDDPEDAEGRSDARSVWRIDDAEEKPDETEKARLAVDVAEDQDEGGGRRQVWCGNAEVTVGVEFSPT